MPQIAMYQNIIERTSCAWHALRAACLWSWRMHLPVIAIVVAYILAEEMIADSVGMPTLFPELIYSSGPGLLIGLASTLLLGSAYGIWLLLAVRPHRPLLHAAREIRHLLRLKRLVMGLSMLLIVQVFIAA